ncbi:alpha/beta hydrolase [Paraburkholderia phymatum]|uniref:alpha/beta hydrolase n=1 Tax=Paraburkholderia phymatum TaxID=148447 RepID=UPI00317115D7
MTVDPRIDADYAFSHRYPERQDVYDRIDAMSVQARLTLRGTCDLAYGAHPLERLDLFPGQPGRPLVVFIHGGYWRSMDKRSFSYVARPLVELGYSVAVVNYPLAPEVRVADIAGSVGRALDWLAVQGRAHLPAYASIVLAGHSAGGHLAACVAGERGTASGIAGCVCISGIFDLEPLMKTSLAAQVHLSPTDVAAWSPLTRAPFDGWMLLAVGTDETPGFVEVQTGRFAARRESADCVTQVLPIEGANHYTVLMAMASRNEALVRALDACTRDAATRP